MVGVVKTAQQKILQIERKSSALIDEFNALMKKFEKHEKFVEELKKGKLENYNKEKLIEAEKEITEVNAAILVLEKEIAKLSQTISATIKDFEKTKNEIVDAKKKHTEGMKAYNTLVDGKKERMEQLKSDLKALEKKVDPKIIAKYIKMRDDRIFPVFVPLLNHSCGGCSMELPSSQINKLEEKGMLECENCHRIIYKKK